jgi:hypothetical protein
LAEEKPSIWIVLVSLLMLFVSGAWTLASIMPFGTQKTIGPLMLVTSTISNVAFLLTLLSAVILYSNMGPRQRLTKIMVYTFSIGVFALIISIILFSTSLLLAPPFRSD